MPLSISVPLQVLGMGLVISYGIAVLIKLILVCIRFFTKKKVNKNA